MCATAPNEGMKPHFSPLRYHTSPSTLESLVIHVLFLYRQKIIVKNEEIYEERSGRSRSVYENHSDTLEDDSNDKQEL